MKELIGEYNKLYIPNNRLQRVLLLTFDLTPTLFSRIFTLFSHTANQLLIFTFRVILFIALPVVRIKSGVQILKIPAYQKIRPTK